MFEYQFYYRVAVSELLERLFVGTILSCLGLGGLLHYPQPLEKQFAYLFWRRYIYWKVYVGEYISLYLLQLSL